MCDQGQRAGAASLAAPPGPGRTRTRFGGARTLHAQGRPEGPEGAVRRLSGSHRTQVLSAAAKVKGCGLRLLAAASCPPLRCGTEVKKLVSDLRFFSVIARLPGHDTSLKKTSATCHHPFWVQLLHLHWSCS